MTRKQGRRTRGAVAPADDGIDHRRLASDIGAFESANGLPHDVVAVGLVALAVATIHTVMTAARRRVVGRRPRI